MRGCRTATGGEKRGGVRRAGADWARLLAARLRHPLAVGAVAPSFLDNRDAIAAHASTHLAESVLELGRIVSVEQEPAFVALLKARFPEVGIVCGDGFDGIQGAGGARGFATPLLALPVLRLRHEQRRVLPEDDLSRLLLGGNPVQLCRRWTTPVRNSIPPARVWIYTPEPWAAPAGRPMTTGGRQ